YTRYSAVVGLRIPLFGSRDVLMQNVRVAESDVAAAEARQQVARMEALKGLRYAYVEHYYRSQQARLADTFMQGEPEMHTMLERRRSARMLLDAEYKTLRTAFHAARNDISVAHAAAADSAEKIRLLTGHTATQFELQAPALPRACKVPARDAQEPLRHPALALYASALEEKRRALSLARPARPRSALTVSHGVHDYRHGSSGNSTALSLDLEFPLGGANAHSAAHKLAQSEVAKAELEFDLQKSEYLAALHKAERDLEVGRRHVTLVTQKLDASKEAQRVARLRASRPEGDAIEQMVKARAGLYQAYHEHVEAQLRLAKARIDLMGLTECEAAPEQPVDVMQEATPLLTQALLSGDVLASKGGSRHALKDGKAAREVPVLGWYAWHALKHFDPARANRFWARIPATDRVLLSLTGAQIKSLKTSAATRRQLGAFLASARKRNVKVAMLLGDPGWVLPGERDKLVTLVRQLKAFPFSGVHLDIEQSQLPAAQHAQWAPGLFEVVRAVRAETNLPVAVSLHPRDARVDGLLAGLQAAGAEEVALMQYSTNQEKVSANLAELMRENRTLRFSLAQSIEPILSREESYARKPEKVATTAWLNIASRLQAEPNFAGIIIQSLDDYLNGALRHEN
ncbi:MAG TPA: TolC family protein, partial [Noviherbaspirillum sp.]